MPSACLLQLWQAGSPEGFFSHIFVDEAGHAEEPLLMCALAGHARSNGSTRVVLAGTACVCVGGGFRSPAWFSKLKTRQEKWPVMAISLGCVCFRCHANCNFVSGVSRPMLPWFSMPS